MGGGNVMGREGIIEWRDCAERMLKERGRQSTIEMEGEDIGGQQT